ncbi:hypothetical protein BDV96DRAFT_604511 [Lophiotrema nucula]|uniref:Uncharacterized protein n=1 Tax=Lophiotrema nucula TaxID=690887 RepID=A0A6A5YR69_9PLEO|nr:hypothetical protein BDV96DRAFT_604511 [Lophiotrema nucula]
MRIIAISGKLAHTSLRVCTISTSHSPPGFKNQNDEPSWLRVANPSRYDVLGIEKHAPYSKQRFTELAKDYHLTIVGTSQTRLSAITCLQSSPKSPTATGIRFIWTRLARSGQTWTYQRWIEHTERNGREAEHSQSHENHVRQEKDFIRNGVSSVVMLLAILVSAWLQTARAAKTSRAMTREQWKRHLVAVERLCQLYTETGHSNKEDRIQRFVIHREVRNGGLGAGVACKPAEICGDS